MVFVSVVIPVYNEQESIASTITRVKHVMAKQGMEYEILAINDGSTDKTDKILSGIKGITVVRHDNNKGYGASIKTGMREAKGDYILITDADGTYPIEEIPNLLKHIPRYDMVVGVRDKTGVPFFRRPAKWFINSLANFLTRTKIPDLNSGMRVFKKSVAMDYWKLYPQGFSFTTTSTMAFLTNGYEVKFVPISYFKRQGKSTIHPIKDTVGFIQLVLRLTLHFNPLRFFMPAFLILLVLGIIRAIRDVLSRQTCISGPWPLSCSSWHSRYSFSGYLQI